ncbi:uncharacterized protein EI90DRAFT_3032892 [Cantharellus anzutake]|uniref:uncharacterized protein n=1 Tax=Cantharellus anzutake TaxID=1750568 RepID=UPI00190431AF|nr:uncharacterized protein EI90DRAFT_3032892 [Cantharellus anzutake]KAF8342320.1 hypothetical protein EI90DRAFT_3032892 [Cantharellus anzutake]
MLSWLDRQGPSQATPTLGNIDLRIRALTTILSRLDPQASSPTKGPSSIEFKVAMHIATLLTRGTDKRGMMGPNIRPFAVTTRTMVDSVNILAMIDRDDGEYPDTPESGLSNDFVTTQNPKSDGLNYELGVAEIESKDLDDVQRDELLSSDRPPEDITLSQHAADVMSLFNNIRAVRRGGTEHARVVRRITTFIVRRCASIISHRLRSDKFIFQDTTLDKILQGWKPSDRDHFVKSECEIPKRLVILFQKRGIQCRWSRGKYFASWTKDIAPLWMKTFTSYLSWCKECFKLDGNKVAGNTTKGAIALKLLQLLIKSEGFKYLLELDSVNAILDREIFKRQRARSNTENPEGSADPQSQTFDDTHTDNLELTAETDEDSVALTMRYLGNVVAWITATDFLFSSSRIRRTPRPRLHLVITAPPAEPKAMANALPIFADILQKSLQDREDQSKGHNSIVHSWFWEFARKLPKSGEFHGMVHCEASLMGAIAQYNGQDGNMQNTRLPDIFHGTSNKPRTIGVAKKCCWCCNMLATLLNSTDIQFSLPGSHGQISPWALPSIGISSEVACSLEDKLQKQLSLAIWKMVDKLKCVPDSQTSSPVVSDNSDKVDDDWEETVKKLDCEVRNGQ